MWTKLRMIAGLILIGILLSACLIWANHGSTSIDKAASITFESATKCDSARGSFYYPDMTNRVDSIVMLPATTGAGVEDSTSLVGTIPQGALDSIGTYIVKVAVYDIGAGSVSRFVFGTWDHNHLVDSVDALNPLGTGPDNLTVFAVDTVSDDTLSNVPVYVRNATGTLEAAGATDVDGAVTFKLTAGTWTIQAGTNIITYDFDDTTHTMVGAYDTMGIWGYPVTIPPPANPDLATLFGYLYDFMGQPTADVIVTLTLETNLNVSASTPGFTIGENLAYDTTDAAGYFGFPVMRGYNYDDSIKSLYNVRGYIGTRPRFILDSIYVPDAGNVDLTDEINAR